VNGAPKGIHVATCPVTIDHVASFWSAPVRWTMPALGGPESRISVPSGDGTPVTLALLVET
jgi:hypothetical protein